MCLVDTVSTGTDGWGRSAMASSPAGKLIREARLAREPQWTRTELAKRSGIDRALICRIEDGTMSGSVTTVVTLAKLLDIDLNLLKLDGLDDAPAVTP